MVIIWCKARFLPWKSHGLSGIQEREHGAGGFTCASPPLDKLESQEYLLEVLEKKKSREEYVLVATTDSQQKYYLQYIPATNKFKYTKKRP